MSVRAWAMICICMLLNDTCSAAAAVKQCILCVLLLCEDVSRISYQVTRTPVVHKISTENRLYADDASLCSTAACPWLRLDS